MNNKHLFLDIHLIQTLPPSNINRDDTGSPKTAQYGGVKRARVSSQSWKRAIREYFNEKSGDANIGVRSLNIVKYIAEKITAMEDNSALDEAMEKANKILNAGGIKTTDNKVKALFFLGESQAKQLAKAAIAGEKDKKVITAILKENPAVDIALFGRMVADDPNLNEDASCQVAHAISTHAVQTEFDFFTAVDDLAPDDNAGAGMLGTVEFNSSTLYRYANVAVHEFEKQLGGNVEEVANALKLFIESFANSLPTGKMNTFANQTLPQAIVVALRNDRPVNLVSAFENPVKAYDGYVDKSIEKLFEEFVKVEKFVNPPEALIYVTLNDSVVLRNAKQAESLHELVDIFGTLIRERI